MKTKVITTVIGASIATAGVTALVQILKSRRDLKKVLDKENELLEISESYLSYLELISKRGRDGWKEESPTDYNQNIFCRVNAVGLSSTIDSDSKSVVSQIQYKPSEKTGAEAYNLMLKLIGAAREYERICDISRDGKDFEYNACLYMLNDSSRDGKDFEYNACLYMFNNSMKDLKNAVESMKAHLDCFR